MCQGPDEEVDFEDEGCEELERELDNFLEDPMTVAMGAQDCAELIVKDHRRGCPKCRAKEERR